MTELTILLDEGTIELLEQCSIEFELTYSFIIGKLIENFLDSPDKARTELGLNCADKYWVCAHGQKELPRDIFSTNDRDLAYDICLRDRKKELERYRNQHKLHFNPFLWTDQQIKEWNDFIFYEGADVWVYNYEEEIYIADYELTSEEKKSIGWLTYKELCADIVSSLAGKVGIV